MLTGIEFSPATTFVWRTSSSDCAYCVWSTCLWAVRSYCSIFAYCGHIRDLVIPSLVTEVCSMLWPAVGALLYRCGGMTAKQRLQVWLRNSLFVAITAELWKLKFWGIFFFSAFLEPDLLVPWVCWSPSKLWFSFRLVSPLILAQRVFWKMRILQSM